jgi:hypothetical protein
MTFAHHLFVVTMQLLDRQTDDAVAKASLSVPKCTTAAVVSRPAPPLVQNLTATAR